MTSQVSIKKIILTVIVEFFGLAALYMASVYFRFSQFTPETFSSCFEMGLNTQELQYCSSLVVNYYLTEPRWLALQFTFLMIPAVTISWLLHKNQQERLIAQSALSGLITAVLIILAIDSPLQPTLVAFLGIPLGGLIAHSRQKNRITFNTS